MPHFYDRHRKLLISTNYKVMFSRLVDEPQLQQIDAAALPAMHRQANDWQVIVRSPYARLESFFKDKFRLNIKARRNGQAPWQHCQQLFFPVLDLDNPLDKRSIQQRFLQTSYAQFIDFLPDCYQQDVHLQPQSYLLDEINTVLSSDGCTRGLEGGVKDYRLIHLESAAETTAFARLSGINMSRRANSTQHLSLDDEPVAEDVLGVIHRLYQNDFTMLGYGMRGLDGSDI
ncbi:MAG: hypothetical protein ACI8WB_003244 [Phenylobacterium sp.]|jgi:hypothetical protein